MSEYVMNQGVKLGGRFYDFVDIFFCRLQAAYVVRIPESYQFENRLQNRADETRLCVIKQIRADKAMCAGKLWESRIALIRRLTELEHENVLKYFGWTETEDVLSQKLEVAIHMEYCARKNLKMYLRLNEIEVDDRYVLHVAKNVLSGLSYLHNLTPTAIIHTDLKAANIFVTASKELRIGDMDDSASKSSTISRSVTITTTCGTLLHMSPEMCKIASDGKPALISVKTDIWSFGCMIIDILTDGNLKYVDSNKEEVSVSPAKKFLEAVFLCEARPDIRLVPPSILPWLMETLKANVQKRISTDNLLKQVMSTSPRSVRNLAQSGKAVRIGDAFYNYTDILSRGRFVLYAVVLPESYEFEQELRRRVGKDRLIVIKQIRVDKEDCGGRTWEETLTLLKRLNTLNHENILKYFGWNKTEKPSSLSLEFSIHMEYCAKSDLDSYIRKNVVTVDERFLLRVAQEVLRGLCYLHTLQPTPIVHTDLRAANVFVAENGQFRIGGMDDCLSMEDNKTKSLDTIMTSRGRTLLHMSPEMCRLALEEERVKLSRKTDVWSFGCMMIDLMTNGNLKYITTVHYAAANEFGQEDEFQFFAGRHMRAVASGKAMPDTSSLPGSFLPWIVEALQTEPSKRISSGDLLKVIETAIQSH